MSLAGLHPNIVPLKGWFRDTDGILCIIMSYCAGGTLANLLKKLRNMSDLLDGVVVANMNDEGLEYFPEDQIMRWFVQLLLALHHLHSLKILHRYKGPVMICSLFDIYFLLLNGIR